MSSERIDKLIAGVTEGAQRQLLTFELASETYGIEILRVREVRGWSGAIRIPGALPHVLGVLNLRGSIVPIVDLRLRFGLERASCTALSVIIVVSVQLKGGQSAVGVLVDSVSDVVSVNDSEVQPVPTLATPDTIGYLRGLVTGGPCMVNWLDVDRLLATPLQEFPQALATA
jgi:purine-binding chemotaxis protein CheW